MWLRAARMMILLALALPAARAQEAPGTATVEPWIDRAQRGLHSTVARSALRIDRFFGPVDEEWAYEHTRGSIAPALLWDEFDGWRPRLRFRVDLPLPRMDERLSAFIGRVNRDEYVTEREQESGALPRQYGPVDDDQTLFGISYREPPRRDWNFSAGGGVRVRTPLDPYVKAGWTYERGAPASVLFTFRETLFWQNSEEFGSTTRFDLTRVVRERWLARSTLSGTISQESSGVRGYASLIAIRALPNRRAIAAQIAASGEADAPVPLREYGVKLAWRQSVKRDWLVLELRSSLSYPKDLLEQPREPSWGVGVGVEMYFGSAEFSAQPVTF
jgi:hypothetical protein